MSDTLTVLYVEDDPLSREVMTMMLELALGHELTIFEDSTDFEQKVADLPQHPDLVLLDIHVAPHDGFEMLKKLRKQPDFAETKIVAVTASVMNEEVDLLRNAGFDGAIGKPINQKIFGELLQRILDGEQIWRIL